MQSSLLFGYLFFRSVFPSSHNLTDERKGLRLGDLDIHEFTDEGFIAVEKNDLVAVGSARIFIGIVFTFSVHENAQNLVFPNEIAFKGDFVLQGKQKVYGLSHG